MSPENYVIKKKTKEDENCQIYNYFLFNNAKSLSDSRKIISRKTDKCALNIRFLYKFVIELKICPLNITFFQKTKNITNSKTWVSLILSNQ